MNTNIRENILSSIKLLSGLLLIATVLSTQADDTEIFDSGSVTNSNVLFVMDNSTSMDDEVEDSETDENDIFNTISRLKDSNNDGVSIDVRWAGRYWTQHMHNHLILGHDYQRTERAAYQQAAPAKQEIAIHFPKVNVHKDAEIESAYIQFTSGSHVRSSMRSRTNLKIELQNLRWGGNCSNPDVIKQRYNDIKQRPRYSEKVVWNNVPVWRRAGVARDAQKTPELKTILDRAFQDACWERNKSLMFIINNEGSNTGSRSVRAYDTADGSSAPVLYINYKKAGVAKTRLQVMKGALKTVLNDAPETINVGIMNYGDVVQESRAGKPNGIRFPVKPISDLARPIIEESITVGDRVRWNKSNIPEPNDEVKVGPFLSEIADDWQANGLTPIVDALYEAALYFRGDKLRFGYGKSAKRFAAHPASYAHPDPDKVEPINRSKVPNSCNQTPRTFIAYNTWTVNLWDAGNGGQRCPANPAHPTGPGNANNCVNTKFACRNRPKCGPAPCTGTNEFGSCISWGTPSCFGTTQQCSYKVCVDEPIPPPNYITPIVSECQSNNIILMSDGKPEYKMANHYPFATNKISTLVSESCEDRPFGFKAGKCGKELAHYLADEDTDNNPNLEGNQIINTQVIGFSSGISNNARNYLKSLVTTDDIETTDIVEGYYDAGNEAELATSFKVILEQLSGKQARSQASPGYSVSVRSGLEHEDSIYIPVFDKTSNSHWPGNLKKFKIVDVDDADDDDFGHRAIRGKKSGGGFKNAMTELGLFEEDAWDLWSENTTHDGNSVEGGGTASLLKDPRDRKLLTNAVGTTLSPLKWTNDDIETEMLFDREELELTEDEAVTYRKKLLNYSRGWTNGNSGGWSNGTGNGFPEEDIPEHARKHMGDMLHSEPVVVSYGENEQYIFAATNEGYLHAFDTDTGEEKFAFMPKELLKNITKQYKSVGDHVYGIDGNISYYQGKYGEETTDRTILFFGLRRGGSSYYALDVTNIESPQLLWTLNASDTGYAKLGQSWSLPYIATILDNGHKKSVVIFSGGHDTNNDYYANGEGSDTESSVTESRPSDIGNDMFIVDAISGGAPLWKLSSKFGGQVTHAIPDGARILDVNRNGLLDRMYFADTGGNIWRLDLDETLGDDSALTKFASLGGSQSRKFYNEPDVAMLRAGGKSLFTISIGSGLRPHPMNKVITDNMFVLLEKSPYAPLAEDYSAITISDLAPIVVTAPTLATKTLTKEGWENKKITDIEGKKGWYLTLPDIGEKVLSTSVTFEGHLIFTTLAPVEMLIDEGACAIRPKSQGRIYILDILTGEPALDINDSDGVNDNDVFSVISANEIPGTPQTLFNKLKCSTGKCKQDGDIRIGKKRTEVGYKNIANIESIYWSDPVSE